MQYPGHFLVLNYSHSAKVGFFAEWKARRKVWVQQFTGRIVIAVVQQDHGLSKHTYFLCYDQCKMKLEFSKVTPHCTAHTRIKEASGNIR